MKVTAKNNPASIASNIDPNQKSDSNVSPVGSINYRYYRDASTKEFTKSSYDVYKNSIARPYLDDGSWNLVHGIFRIPDYYRVFWEIERAPANLDYLIDSASVTKFECDEYNLVRNGDMEYHKTKYWDTWGSKTILDLVSTGGSQALRASGRTDNDHGPLQWINADCLSPGDRIMFTAKIKFEDSNTGANSSCNPYSWSSSDRCAEWSLQRKWSNGAYTTSRVGEVVTDDQVDGW